VREGVAARRRRAEDFRAALSGWRTWCAGRSWLGSVGQLEADAIGQRDAAEAACASWDRDWSEAETRLRECLGRVRAVLRSYDAPLSAGTTLKEATVRLTRAQRQALGLDQAEESATWVLTNWPDPGDEVEAAFALWEASHGGPGQQAES
jgi:hypothetical protein